MLVKNVINPNKRNHIQGTTFSVLFLGIEAVLYDELWDEPIIYGNKNVVKIKTRNLSDILPATVKNVTIFYYAPYKGEMKKRFKFDGPIGSILVPNY
jgi:hypothetical protein